MNTIQNYKIDYKIEEDAVVAWAISQTESAPTEKLTERDMDLIMFLCA